LGQRLIIKNNFNGTTRSAIYYHWSAYTFEAIEEIKNLVSKVFWSMKIQLSELPNLSTEQHLDIACLNAVSGVPERSQPSIDYINSLLPKPYDNSNVHRNDGLIAFDEVGQKSLIDWGEGFVTINWVLDTNGEVDLDNTTFDFDVFFTMQEDELHTNWDVPKSVIKQLKKFNYLIDLTNIPVASTDIFKAELKLLKKNLKQYLSDHSIEKQYDWWYDKEAKLFHSIIQ
jgi:hypothetical protein